MEINLKEILKKYYMLILFIVFLPFGIWIFKYQKDLNINRNIIFDTTNISGLIDKINYFRGGTSFVFPNKEEFYFTDIIVSIKQIPKSQRLHNIAERGDSIYKAAYGDTLFLYKKNGKKYYFVFNRKDLYW